MPSVERGHANWRARLAGSARLVAQAPRQGRLPFRPLAQIERRRDRNVAAAVAYAHAHVPHYREALRRLGLTPADFTTAADLARLPLIERAELQADPERFSSDAFDAQRCLRLHSGGSTDRPVPVLREPAAFFRATIHAQRARSVVVGIAGGFRFRELLIVPPGSTGVVMAQRFRRASLVPDRVRGPQLRLSLMEPPAAHVDAIDAFAPDVIRSYGSYLEALFAHLEAIGYEGRLPKAVVYAADPMSDGARRRIAERFGVRVLSVYQSIESGQVGFECERHRGFHMNIDLTPSRIVDAEGRDVPDGEPGEVVTSELCSRATVLLNYRLGDVARRIGPCTCGRTLPMLSFLEGRTVEWLRSAAGEPVHPQAVKGPLSRADDVRRYQVVQDAPGRLDVAIVPAPGAGLAELTAALREQLTERVGPGTQTSVRFVEDLPRTPGGKVRPIVVRA